jgi:hypothetical protein
MRAPSLVTVIQSQRVFAGIAVIAGGSPTLIARVAVEAMNCRTARQARNDLLKQCFALG